MQSRLGWPHSATCRGVGLFHSRPPLPGAGRTGSRRPRPCIRCMARAFFVWWPRATRECAAMSTATATSDLSSRLDAVVEEARGKVKAFQQQAESSRQEIRARFETFLPIAERIVAMAREKLERLRERLEFDVRPAHVQTERFYSRSVTLDVKSE